MVGFRVPDEVRCTWVRVNGTRCGSRVAVDGNTLCHWHEDASLQRLKYWNRAAVTEDVSLQDHLVAELKMCLVQLRELEFQVLDLGLSVEAWRTPTSERTTRAGEDAKNQYVEHKRAQVLGAHPVVVQFLREREHHLRVVSLCVSAGLAQRQLQVVEQYVDSLVSSQTALAEALGHDPSDPLVRAAITDVVRREHVRLSEVSPARVAGELEAG